MITANIKINMKDIKKHEIKKILNIIMKRLKLNINEKSLSQIIKQDEGYD